MATYCGNCQREIKGAMEEHHCSVCGMTLCPFCAIRKGGFLGLFGGVEYCPAHGKGKGTQMHRAEPGG